MRKLVPLPDLVFEELVSPWLKVASKGESASIINISQRSQLYHINQLLTKQDLLEKYLEDSKNYNMVVLNLMSLPIETPEKLEQYLKDQLKNEKRNIVFILDADSLIEETPELLGLINTFPYRYKNLSFLFLFKKNIIMARMLKLLSKYSILYQNVLIPSLYSKEAILHFIVYKSSKLNKKIPDIIAQKIAEQCGGRTWLVSQAVRYFAETGDQKHIFDHDAMQFRVKAIYNEYEPEEKEVLKKIVNKASNFSEEDQEVLHYFSQTRLIELTGSQYNLTIPILEEYIKSTITGHFSFSITKNNQIFINDIDVQGVLSRGQRRLLAYFIKNPNKIISRDQVASMLWQLKEENQYSDWALDRAITRIRQKLSMLGLNRNLIETVRGRGFIFKST